MVVIGVKLKNIQIFHFSREKYFFWHDQKKVFTNFWAV